MRLYSSFAMAKALDSAFVLPLILGLPGFMGPRGYPAGVTAPLLLGLYRNPTAHDPKLHRDVTDTELVDALTAMSMVHQRLDDAVVKP